MSTVTRDSQDESNANMSMPEGFTEQSFAGVKTFVKQGVSATESKDASGTVFVMLPAYNEGEGLPRPPVPRDRCRRRQ